MYMRTLCFCALHFGRSGQTETVQTIEQKCETRLLQTLDVRQALKEFEENKEKQCSHAEISHVQLESCHQFSLKIALTKIEKRTLCH